MRAHLSQLRQAAHGLGHDFGIRFEEIGENIERLPTLTAEEARRAAWEIEDELASAGHRIDAELKVLPHQIGHGIATGAGEIRDGAVRVGAATRDEFEEVGHKAREGTKNALATAAGVRRTPMKGWSAPSPASSGSDNSDG